jgi:hypothetical protein
MLLLKQKDKFPAIVSLPFLSIIMLATIHDTSFEVPLPSCKYTWNRNEIESTRGSIQFADMPLKKTSNEK